VVCGQDDDRERGGAHLRPQLLQHAKPVEPGHVHVEKDQADRVLFQLIERVRSVDRLDHLETLVLEHIPDQPAHLRIVISHQDTILRSCSRRGRSCGRSGRRDRWRCTHRSGILTGPVSQDPDELVQGRRPDRWR
jgi:hypothetical protein